MNVEHPRVLSRIAGSARAQGLRARALPLGALAAVLCAASFGAAPLAAADGYQSWQWEGGQTTVTALSADKNDGYLVIVNNDNSEMSLDINVDSRTIYLRRDRSGQGMFTLPEGGEFPVRVRKGDYKLYWGVGSHVQVKVRSNQTTTLAFDAYGRNGDGLRAVVNDGERLNEYTLYESAVVYQNQVLQETYAIRDGRRQRVTVISSPVVVAERAYVPDPPSVQLWVGGAIRLVDAISRIFGNDRDRHHHDSRHGYNYQYTSRRGKRVYYSPSTTVVVQPRPTVVRPAPVVVRPAPVVVRPAPVVVRPAPVVVRPAPVVVQPSRPGPGRQPPPPPGRYDNRHDNRYDNRYDNRNNPRRRR